VTSEDPAEMFTRLGGEPFFTALVAGFYARVAVDPVLRPMYPEADLTAAAERLRLFLMQYWGGPQTYSEQRGHPRLRMRHAPFRIDLVAHNHWLSCMHDALLEQHLPADLAEPVWEYLRMAARAMINANPAFDTAGPGSGLR